MSFSLNAEILKIIRNYYDPLSVISIAITIYSALSYFKIIELANTFSLLTFSLKQPKLLFKMPPSEDASQTAMKYQKEAQFEEKAVKYFIGRLFRVFGTEMSKYIYFLSGHTG